MNTPPIRRTHGEAGRGWKTTRSPEYAAWAHMIQRCCNPRSKSFSNYGGRGITICERWRSSYAAFLQDVGRRPSSAHSIERKDNNGHYEPSNCVWATRSEQNRNLRTNHRVEFNGENLTLVEWQQRTGVCGRTIAWRISSGWPLAIALTLKPSRFSRTARKYARI